MIIAGVLQFIPWCHVEELLGTLAAMNAGATAMY